MIKAAKGQRYRKQFHTADNKRKATWNAVKLERGEDFMVTHNLKIEINDRETSDPRTIVEYCNSYSNIIASESERLNKVHS